MGLLKLTQNAKSLSRKSDAYKLALEVLKGFQGYLIEEQQDQLNDGKESTGKPLFSIINRRGYYSEATEEIARKENPRKPKKAGEPYNLEYTGAFIDSIFFEVTARQGKFGATDPKTRKLLREFGDKLFGLSPDNLDKFLVEKFKPEFIKRWKQRLLT